MWAWRLAGLAWCLRAAAQQGGPAVSDKFVCSSAPTQDGASPILVGGSQALDCCSAYAPWGRQYLQSYHLFTTWLSSRGGVSVGGVRRPLEIRVLNDRSQIDLVQASYAQHVRDGLSLLLGPWASPGSIAAGNIANASGALLLCPAASDPMVMEGRPSVFSTVPAASKYTTCALEALAAKGAKTIAYIAENLSSQLSWCRPLAAAAGSYGMNVTFSRVMPARPDRNATAAALAELRSAGADVVFACVQLQACLDVADEMQASAYYPKAVVLPACTTASEWTSRGESGLFFTGTTPWLPYMPLRSTLTGWTAQEFADLYFQAFNQQVAWQAAAAFATLEVLVTAIERANSTDADKVAAQVRVMQVDTVFGTINFDSTRQVRLNMRAIQAVKLNGDPPPVVSPLAFATKGITYPMPGAKERSCLGMNRADSTYGFNSEGLCVECPAGYASVWNATTSVWSCFYCPPGYLYQNGRCSACPAGRITVAAGQPRCANCSAGTYVAESGKSRCDPCPAGSVSATDGATACDVCPPGNFGQDSGLSVCMACVAGTFVAEPGATTCRPCPSGTYAESGGMASCTPCLGGRMTAELGAWSADSCVCDKASYFEDGRCNQCPRLQTTPDMGATSRSACSLNEAGRAIVAIVVCSAVGFPACFLAVWGCMKRKLDRAERLRLISLQQQLHSGLRTIKEFQHPMVLIDGVSFLLLTDRELQAGHEGARERGLLKTFDTAQQVAEYRLRHPRCRIILFSYEWLSWERKGPNCVQAAWMRRALGLYCKKHGLEAGEAFVWLDMLSIPQVNEAVQVLAVNSLYTYAASADALLIVAPPSLHEGTGEASGLQTYRKRSWTRMELFAQVAAHGLDSVYIATEDALEAATPAWVEDIINIFAGNMTCCRLKHKDRDRCDKESLVLPLLGVWYLLSGGAAPLKNSGAALLYSIIRARKGEVFPSHFAFETEEGTERRQLFGDLIPLLDKHLRQRRLSEVPVEESPTPTLREAVTPARRQSEGHLLPEEYGAGITIDRDIFADKV